MYTQALIHKENNGYYLEQMALEKEKITGEEFAGLFLNPATV